MIGRFSASVIASTYAETFAYSDSERIDTGQLYELLFEKDYPVWVCNTMRRLEDKQSLTEFIMRLQTGESLVEEMGDSNPAERQARGQSLLFSLANDILVHLDNPFSDPMVDGVDPYAELLVMTLDSDGYTYRDGRLCRSEADVIDVKQEDGVLGSLYASLALANRDLFRHHSRRTQTTYLDGHWGDCIHNSRLVLEGVLREVAAVHSSRVKGGELRKDIYDKPVEVRRYLEEEGLLDKKEREVIQHTYGLLSSYGSHPYMADKDQARLLRNLALTLAQFVLLRLEGALKATQ